MEQRQYQKYSSDSQKSKRSRSRSRQKKPKGEYFTKQAQNLRNRSRRNRQIKGGQLTYKEYLAKQQEFHENQQLIRSFLRIQQSREQPIDKFVKILYVYKGKYKFDHRLLDIMKQPKKYLNKLSIIQLEEMIPQAEIHLKSQRHMDTQFIDFWKSLIQLIKYKIFKKKQTDSPITQQFKAQVKEIMKKSVQELNQLEKIHKFMITSGGTDSQVQYWKALLQKIKAKKLQLKIIQFCQNYLHEHPDAIKQEKQQQENQQFINTSPLLIPNKAYITEKMLSTDVQDRRQRQQLSQRIFRQQFEKNKQKLETNLSVPKNQNFSNTNIISESTNTYDFISKQIMEFQKYKRLEEDEEQFTDQVAVQTEGRFRDRKPIYINRVRVSYDFSKQKKNDDTPPPKAIQGYRFTIFYPDLLDKQKTPQYYLERFEQQEDSGFCLITFKAGPPYKDIAFKIVKKEWDFSHKSGFESIFAKGILHLYFNFKKPRFWI